MKKCILAMFLICSISILAQEITSYDMDVKINVKSKSVAVNCNINADFQHNDTLKLILWKYSTINKMHSSESELNYTFDTVSPSPAIYIKKGANLTIIKSPGTPDKQKITINYVCNMEDMNGWAQNFSDDWIELNYYSAWFPVNLNSFNFASNIYVHIDKDYLITGNGEVSKVNDYWGIKRKWKDFDNVIVASKNLNSKSTDENDPEIEVIYGDYPEAAADSILTECRYTLDLLEKYFGGTDAIHLKYVIAPFETGGGYSRKNFISMRTKKFDLYTQSKGIAHEIGHFWWHKASAASWEDWLNESFAEYSMLMYIRARFGVDEFNKKLNDYKNKTAGLPSIWGIDRNSNQAYSVLYEKGSVILSELENKIGGDKYLSLLRDMHDENINNTKDFLSLLEKETAVDVREWMENKLKN